MSLRETVITECVMTGQVRRYFRGKLDSNGALACKEEPLHSWAPGFNHELDGQQQRQVSLVPTAVYS